MASPACSTKRRSSRSIGRSSNRGTQGRAGHGPRLPLPSSRLAMIEACALRKRYGRLLAVDGIGFRAEPGEVLGVLGPNGAGKSTTM